MVDYERLRPTERVWDLEAVASLLRREGAAPPARPAVQVAGSKGKGTTAAFLEALAAGAGRVVGCYTSPHVETLRERIRVGGALVPEAELRQLLEQALQVHPAAPPTFFEAMTVAAVEWFARSGVDFAVYEVGLGGRFDATTAIDVDASIVTRIELEHTDVLGDTIAAIAAEKAPVIRPGGVGLTGTDGEALAVVRRHAASVGAELLELDRDFGVAEVRHDAAGGFEGVLWFGVGARERRPFRLVQAAAFQLPALALAAATLHRLLPELELPLLPVPSPSLMCRFEVFEEGDGEVLVLDGAHTEQSLGAVAAELERRFPGRRAAVLTAAAAGKRWREGLSALMPAADSFVVTDLSGTSCEDPEAIAAWLASAGVRSEVAIDAVDGLRRLRERPGPRLVVGSFYLAGAIRQILDVGRDS